MNRPLIGISGSHNVADRQMFVRENYMQSVLRARADSRAAPGNRG